MFPSQAPLAFNNLGLVWMGQTVSFDQPAVVLRAAPLTPDRLADWAVSKRAGDALVHAVWELTHDARIVEEPTPAASGLIVRARTNGTVPPLIGLEPQGWSATTVADAAGIVGAGIQYWVSTPPREQTTLTLMGLRDAVIVPLLRAVSSIIEAAEVYGRCLLELRVGYVADVLRLDDVGGHKPIRAVPVGGEITFPLDPGSDELAALADRWRDDIGREAGYPTLRP
jgi:hypothetical protein